MNSLGVKTSERTQSKTMSAQRRIETLTRHLSLSEETQRSSIQHHNTSAQVEKSDDDIVIISPVRTAIARAGRGATKDSTADQLLAPVLKEVIQRSGVDPSLVEDVVVGKVLENSLLGANQVRIASFLAGIPNTASCQVVNRQCSSGLQALATVVGSIKSGQYEIGIAGGVESMTRGSAATMTLWNDNKTSDAENHKEAKDVFVPMLVTSENVAALYKISREKQDEVAAESHRRAGEAISKGLFKREIVPVELKVKDKEGKEQTIVFDQDEGVREGTTKEGLGKLQPVIKKDGCSSTAGNSSQVSDGAAAMLVMKRGTAKRLGLESKIELSYMGFATVGVPPKLMGVGPAYAIPKVLKQVGLSVQDVDIFEINEAFASQYIYCADKLGLDMNKVNVRGGAIALGHPLGATGARMVATLSNILRDENKKIGVISMCIGSGMGAACVLRREN